MPGWTFWLAFLLFLVCCLVGVFCPSINEAKLSTTPLLGQSGPSVNGTQLLTTTLLQGLPIKKPSEAEDYQRQDQSAFDLHNKSPLLSITQAILATTTLAPHAVRRHVYVDMGANWANTLRLWRDVAKGRSELWEVYAFEASPLIQPYVEEFVVWLNGGGPKPPLVIPPAGSSTHLKMYARMYGCSTTQFRECMWKKFKRPLATLKPNPALNSTALVTSRLAEAGHPATFKSRYTFVPAAVSSANGTLELGVVDADQMIRGGAISYGSGARAGVHMTVLMVDVVSWMISHFREDDFIFVKLDAEGAEHMILNTLIQRGKFNLIDVLLMECHGIAGNCNNLMTRVRNEAARTRTQVLTESSKYPGYDSFSAPNLYFPIEP